MNLRAWIYGTLSLVGFVLSQYYLLRFVDEVQGEPGLWGVLSFDAVAFATAGFANPAAAFLTIDVLIAVACFLMWIFPEAKRLDMKHTWVYAVLTFAVSFGVSFPLFMMMRERALLQKSPQPAPTGPV